MIMTKRIVSYALIMLFVNLAFLTRVLNAGTLIDVLLCMALAAFYIYYNIAPRKALSVTRQSRILIGGYELTLAAIACFTLEVILYTYILVSGMEIEILALIANGVACAILLLIMLLNGIIRIFICSRQLGIMPRLLLLFLWWFPVLNIIILRRFIVASGAEYEFTVVKQRLNEDRKSEELCKTKYPLLMVHGVFFRDWENFNYWGRIPKELMDNGAKIFYGNHQSSASVEHCAGELKQCILDIVKETGCEKVNVIAHSKGGLDARYAISCLGMGEFVASLTTINTPHLGCGFVRKLMDKLPKKAVAATGKVYESVYSKLGDDDPDFFSSLKDLTEEECSRLNEIMKDYPGVLYQSVGSRMRSHSSAPFPLNLGYSIIKHYGGGENDGLVTTRSMPWGSFLGILSPSGKQGISHGDLIDLTRKNIEGFDVCEFYVDLVNKLKQKGC